MQIITVSPPGASASGMFHHVSDAIGSIPDDNRSPVTICLAPGVYHEKVVLEKPNVMLLGTGTSPAETVISYDDYGYDLMPDGKKRGTFRSYTLFVHAPDVTLRNLTVENASGDSKTHGQAIALYAECDRFWVDSCRLLGHQDTLFTGPLPPQEYEPDGFLGPTKSAPRINGRQYYKDCYICGDIDFIFGSATAYFEACTIESLGHSRIQENITSVNQPEGYVTAASTPAGQEYGYVFSCCRFVSSDCPPGSVYLGRPWRDYAKTVLIDCALGAHIHPAGFHDWNKTHTHKTVFYGEYQSRSPDDNLLHDISLRADFVHNLDFVQASRYTKEHILPGLFL